MQVVHQSRPVVPRDKFLRLPAVEELVGLKKSTIYELMRKPTSEGGFPKPTRLGRRTVAWPESAVLTWVQERIAEARQ